MNKADTTKVRAKKEQVMLPFFEFTSVVPVIEPEVIGIHALQDSAVCELIAESTSEEALRARRLKSLNQRNQRQGHRKQFTYNKTLTYSGAA